MQKLLLMWCLFLLLQQSTLAQASVSDRIYRGIQTMKTTDFHKNLEKQRDLVSRSAARFKAHLEVYPVDADDPDLLKIKAGYARVRNQYNFALERLKMDLGNPNLVQKIIRNPERRTKRYLDEINQAGEDYRFYVQRPMDEMMEGAYSSLPVWETIIAAWTIYQVLEKIVKHFAGLSNEWKQEYGQVAPALLETYYFSDLRLPPWDELR